MTSKLPINLENLLRQRQVEGERIEYKAGWNPDAILRTLCAFANDFENLGGGYVVIGQDCDAAGMPVFPPVGLEDNRYRWASCTVKDNVNINWRLIKAPMFVIDYVIVHELAHLMEANHTPRFWNIVRAKAPSSEKAKTWLKEHGQILEEEV